MTGRVGKTAAKNMTQAERKRRAKAAARARWDRKGIQASVSQQAKLEHAEEAFRERVYWHTLAVVNLATLELPQIFATSQGFRSAAEEPFGTGTAVRWKGHELILTAGHVVEDASVTQIALMPRPASSLKELVPGSKVKLQRRIEPRVRRIIRCEWEDLAFIELEDGEAHGLKIQFADLAGSRSPRVSTMLAYLGHPVDSTYEVGRVKHANQVQISKAVGPMITAGKITYLAPKEAQCFSGFDSKRHFVVEFPPADLGISGKGFSGAGFWYYHEASRLGWEPEARLAGICTHRYMGKRLVKGVRIESVRRFLDERI